jgi:hypothetical protein
VSWSPNFDASVEEPTVLPARLPLLLINGGAGIAVGIATKVPPHNVHEVVAGLTALIADPGISVRQLMAHIPAPDFPTGAPRRRRRCRHNSAFFLAPSCIECTGGIPPPPLSLCTWLPGAWVAALGPAAPLLPRCRRLDIRPLPSLLAAWHCRPPLLLVPMSCLAPAAPHPSLAHQAARSS